MSDSEKNNVDLEPTDGLIGADGALFLSTRHPLVALKRWYKSHQPKMKESIQLLEGARKAVRENDPLSTDLEVTEIQDRGSDWAKVSFDPSSVPLRQAIQDADVAAARSRVISALETTSDKHLQQVLHIIRRNSENAHWSPLKHKILIVTIDPSVST